MATLKTFEATIGPNNTSMTKTNAGAFKATVQAKDRLQAQKMLEGQYGREKVTHIREIR